MENLKELIEENVSFIKGEMEIVELDEVLTELEKMLGEQTPEHDEVDIYSYFTKEQLIEIIENLK